MPLHAQIPAPTDAVQRINPAASNPCFRTCGRENIGPTVTVGEYASVARLPQHGALDADAAEWQASARDCGQT